MNAEWGKYLMWGVGAIVVLGVIVKLRKGGDENQSASTPTSPTPMPLFMSGVGGLSGASGGLSATLPLGGEAWQSPEVPLSENPDVAIANIQKEIALAQIAANQDVATKGLSALNPQYGSGGLTGNGDGTILPPQSRNGAGFLLHPDRTLEQQAAINQYAGINTSYNADGTLKLPPAYNPATAKLSDNAAVSGIKNIVKSAGGGLNDKAAYSIYDQAAARGYTAAETAALLNKSGAGNGQIITAAQVNSWSKSRGLKPLN